MIFKVILVIDGLDVQCQVALIWMSMDLTDDKSTLVQVMVWCRQATSHYLNQCWPRSTSPYGVTRPQWVNSLTPERCGSDYKSNVFKIIIQNDNVKIIIQNSNMDICFEIPLASVCSGFINSLRPSDAFWRHRSGSPLAQVMACCLTAPSHFLNQCWLIISKIKLHSSDGKFTRDTSVINDWN